MFSGAITVQEVLLNLSLQHDLATHPSVTSRRRVITVDLHQIRQIHLHDSEILRKQQLPTPVDLPVDHHRVAQDHHKDLDRRHHRFLHLHLCFHQILQVDHHLDRSSTCITCLHLDRHRADHQALRVTDLRGLHFLHKERFSFSNHLVCRSQNSMRIRINPYGPRAFSQFTMGRTHRHI